MVKILLGKLCSQFGGGLECKDLRDFDVYDSGGSSIVVMMKKK